VVELQVMMQVFSIVKERNIHALYEVTRLKDKDLSGLHACPFCRSPVQRTGGAHAGAASAASSDSRAGSVSRNTTHAKAEVFDKLRKANAVEFLKDVDFTALRACYVPPKEGVGDTDLLGEVKKTLDGSGPRVQLLLGQSGSGKTTFTKLLYDSMWGEFMRGESTSVPLFVSLPQMTGNPVDIVDRSPTLSPQPSHSNPLTPTLTPTLSP
jgi:hypothetical protein